MAKIDLSVVSKREKLKPKPNRSPYWHRLRPGCFVGYRPSTDGAAGTWAAKAYVDGKTRLRPLGSFGEFQASERFAKAKAAAEEFMKVEEAGGRSHQLLVTVEDACRKYVEEGHAGADPFFRLSVYGGGRKNTPPDPIAKIPLEKLRRNDLVEWRRRLETRGKTRGAGALSPASINREIAPLRAALHQVMPHGMPKTEAAWQEALKVIPKKIAQKSRTLTLDRQQRQALLAHISPEVEPFVRMLCLLPVRPGALAQLTVSAFNRQTGVLYIPAGLDKGHGERNFNVGAAAHPLLVAQAKDKIGKALLFTRADGSPWTRENWGEPIRRAALAAGLDPATCAYTLRHSVITDLVEQSVPTLTIADIAGTSVAMIEEHYGHLREKAAREALSRLAL